MADIATVSKYFLQQREAIRVCNDLMGGTTVMRKAGERYIERGDSSPEAFQSRLDRTVLLNAYRRTLNFLRGQVFQKPVTVGGSESDSLGEEQKAQFAAWMEDVDLRGHNVTAWSGNVFRQGIEDGVTFTVVDYSAVPTRIENGVTEYQKPDGTWARKTMAADMENGWRPYLVHVSASQVLDAWGVWGNGRYTVEHFRYIESVQVPDGEWARKTVQQIRAFWRDEAGKVSWQVWRNESAASKEYALHSEGTLSLGEVPVVAFMPGDAVTDWTAEPALIDLAWLNVRHWQVSGGHAELIEYVQRPVWFAAGLEMQDEQGEKLPFGPGRLVCSPMAATLQSVGVDSGSYTASRQELESLETAMAMYGLQLLQLKQVSVTATESVRDTEENNSTLMAWALGYQDFLENCLRLMALWSGLQDGPSASVNTDFAKAVDMTLILEMQRANVLSAETALTVARAAGVLPDDFVVEDEAAKVAREVGTAGSLAGGGAAGMTALLAGAARGI